MQKKLIVSAIALVSMSMANAQSFLADSPADEIHINDNAFTNPALIGTTEDQLTLTDQSGGQLGWVTTQFGQKLGIHLGDDVNGLYDPDPNNYSGNVDTTVLGNFVLLDEALDLFWGTNLGFGALGVNATLAAQSDRDIVESSRAAAQNSSLTYYYTSSNKATADDGADAFALDVSDNERKESSSYYALDAGVALNDLPATVNVRIALPSASSNYALGWTDTQNVGATGGAEATARNIVSQTDIVGSDVGGMETSLSGTFNLTSSLRLNAGISIDSEKIASTNQSVVGSKTDADLTTLAYDTDTTTTKKDSFDNDTGVFSAVAGARYTRQAGAVEIVVDGQFGMASTTNNTTYTINKYTIVDAVAGTTTDLRTGVNGKAENKTLELYMPIRVSAEWAASEKWTWRAGTEANLFYYRNEKTTQTSYKASPDSATAFVEDVVNSTQDASFIVLPSFVNNIDLGFSYSPLENVTFDAIVTTSFLENGILSTGPIDNASLAVTFRY